VCIYVGMPVFAKVYMCFDLVSNKVDMPVFMQGAVFMRIALLVCWNMHAGFHLSVYSCEDVCLYVCIQLHMSMSAPLGFRINLISMYVCPF